MQPHLDVRSPHGHARGFVIAIRHSADANRLDEELELWDGNTPLHFEHEGRRRPIQLRHLQRRDFAHVPPLHEHHDLHLRPRPPRPAAHTVHSQSRPRRRHSR